jgi:uncharacterized RDD family membrane protein YckC
MKSIEITTTQNVTIEYELAPLGARGLAAFLDWLLVWLLYGVLILVLRGAWMEALPVHVWLLIVPIGCFFVYNMVLEMFNGGRTVGKFALGTKVVRLDGRDPEWADVLMRAALHLVDSILTFGVFGALLIKTTDKSQRFGDMAAGTTVIKTGSSIGTFRLHDILNIQHLGTHIPVYPQVRNLSESDMIFIKNTLARFQQYPNHAHEIAIEDLVTHLMPLLSIETRPLNRVEFLKTLLRDYIVLTR